MGIDEWLMLRKDGSRFIAEGTAAMIRDTYGEPKSLVVFTWEITERKRVEQALRESEERYRSLIETSPSSIVLSDLDGTILMVNQAGDIVATDFDGYSGSGAPLATHAAFISGAGNSITGLIAVGTIGGDNRMWTQVK